MGPVSLKVRYRPLRMGWCIDAENRDDFLAAVSLSHVFWGGRYFPIIPCASQELSRAIVRAFHVDALYNVSGTPAVDAFIADFPYLRWPDYHPELFADTGGQKLATLLDVAHPAQQLFETHVDRRDKPRIEASLYQWQVWEDPLDIESDLSEDERMVRDSTRGFAQDTLMPRIVEAWREEKYDR